MRDFGFGAKLAGASLAVLALSAQALAGDALSDAGEPLPQPGSDMILQRLAIAFGVGAQVFELPDLPAGVFASGQGDFDRETGGAVAGPIFSAALAGQIGDTPYSLELSGAYSALSNKDTAAFSFTGPGALFIPGPTNLTAGRIGLSTAAGPTGGSAGAQASVSGPSGSGASSLQTTASPPGSQSRQFGLSPLAGGGALTSTGADGSRPDGTAFAAVGNGEEFAVAAVGNLDGFELRTTTDEEFEQGILEMRIGRATNIAETWSFTPSIAPSFRHISRELRTAATLAPRAGSPADGRLASVSVISEEDLSADYWGALLGATLTGQMSESLFVNLGGDIGLAYYKADYAVSSRARIVSNRIAGIFDTGAVQGPGQSDDDLTYFGRLKAALAYADGPRVLSLGVQAEYIADVPTLARGPYADFSQTDAALAAGGATGGPTTTLTSEDVWNYGANVGFTYAF